MKYFKKWRSVPTLSVPANKKTIGRLHIENRYPASKTWGSKIFRFYAQADTSVRKSITLDYG